MQLVLPIQYYNNNRKHSEYAISPQHWAFSEMSKPRLTPHLAWRLVEISRSPASRVLMEAPAATIWVITQLLAHWHVFWTPILDSVSWIRFKALQHSVGGSSGRFLLWRITAQSWIFWDTSAHRGSVVSLSIVIKAIGKRRRRMCISAFNTLSILLTLWIG